MITLRSLPQVVGQLGIDLCDEELVWVRSAWRLEGEDTWRLRLLEIVAGSKPPGWDSNSWRYPSLSFFADELPGRYAGQWLMDGTLAVDGHEHDLSKSDDRLTWERRDSHARMGYQVFDWPSYEVQLGQLDNNEPQRPFLSDTGAPSFMSFYNAAACFFGLGSSSPGGQVPQSAVCRWVDRRARINSVGIAEDELRVVVEGDALDGLVVELAGDAPGPIETVTTTQSLATVIFPLPNGLPPGAWVVIRAGSEWLDRRFLAWPWTRGQEPGVTVDVSAKTKLDAFIAGRENDAVEFKRGIPDDEPTKTRAMKTVCAFANGSGGSLLFGITDNYEVVGVPEAKASRNIDTLSEMVDAWVEPTPSYGFEVLPIEGTAMVVIELIVSAGSALFGSSKPNETRLVYIRHHSRSVPARVREIEGIVQARGVTSASWQR